MRQLPLRGWSRITWSEVESIGTLPDYLQWTPVRSAGQFETDAWVTAGLRIRVYYEGEETTSRIRTYDDYLRAKNLGRAGVYSPPTFLREPLTFSTNDSNVLEGQLLRFFYYGELTGQSTNLPFPNQVINVPLTVIEFQDEIQFVRRPSQPDVPIAWQGIRIRINSGTGIDDDAKWTSGLNNGVTGWVAAGHGARQASAIRWNVTGGDLDNIDAVTNSQWQIMPSGLHESIFTYYSLEAIYDGGRTLDISPLMRLPGGDQTDNTIVNQARFEQRRLFGKRTQTTITTGVGTPGTGDLIGFGMVNLGVGHDETEMGELSITFSLPRLPTAPATLPGQAGIDTEHTTGVTTDQFQWSPWIIGDNTTSRVSGLFGDNLDEDRDGIVRSGTREIAGLTLGGTTREAMLTRRAFSTGLEAELPRDITLLPLR